MPPRKLNALERKLHQIALSKSEHIISQQDIDKIEPRATERIAAINFLLGTGLFVVLSGKGSNLLYKAVAQDVIEVKKNLTQEETMVLDRIRASGNQGIWTKHIKSQTQLHQTVVDRALKTLAQKQLVKTVNDVRNKTRKIYMLAHIEPAVELTGGPWYTDKELDTEFIKLLSNVCLKIIRDRSMPRSPPDEPSDNRRLFPVAYSSYPTARQILALLKKSRVTETELDVYHLEMLLEVLFLDGKIEKLPVFHLPQSIWDDEEVSGNVGSTKIARRSSQHEHRGDSDSDEPSATTMHQHMLASDLHSGDDISIGSVNKDDRRSRKRRRRHRSDTDSDDVIASEDDRRSYTRTPRRQRSDSEDASTSEDDQPSRKRRRRSHRSHSEDTYRTGKGKMKDTASAMDDSSEGESSGHTDIDRQYNNPKPQLGASLLTDQAVYRAVYDEQLTLGINQTPCVVCPVATFCKDGGPVNPQGCVHYDSWINAPN